MKCKRTVYCLAESMDEAPYVGAVAAKGHHSPQVFWQRGVHSMRECLHLLSPKIHQHLYDFYLFERMDSKNIGGN